MLVLVYALAIGQIEDVATLRARYEKAQKSYEMLQTSHNRLQAMYDEMDDRSTRQLESRRIDALERLFASHFAAPNPQLEAIREKMKEQQARHTKLHEEHRRTMSRLLRDSEARMRQFKQQVDALKWQYEQAAGRPSEHWA